MKDDPTDRDGIYQVACEGMIPAERCVLLFWPSMSEREAFTGQRPDAWLRIPAVVMHTLESHGVDEIGCKWEGVLQMTRRYVMNSGGQSELIADCPRCGSEIILR